MTETMIIKKISAKTVLGNVKTLDEGKLMTVIGIASGTKGGESNFGSWECLTGSFQAIRHSDGQQFNSGVCFLPDVGHDLVAGQVHMEENSSVEFAFDILKKNDADVAAGYIYSVVPLIKVNPEEDPLSRLLAKALPAPANAKK